jgi:hypothetical protein
MYDLGDPIGEGHYSISEHLRAVLKLVDVAEPKDSVDTDTGQQRVDRARTIGHV